MEINEYSWFKSNFDNLEADEKNKAVKLGLKSWLDSPSGEVNIGGFEFAKALRYLDKLYKKYNNNNNNQ